MMIPIGCAVIAFFTLGVLAVQQLFRIASDVKRFVDIVDDRDIERQKKQFLKERE